MTGITFSRDCHGFYIGDRVEEATGAIVTALLWFWADGRNGIKCRQECTWVESKGVSPPTEKIFRELTRYLLFTQ